MLPTAPEVAARRLCGCMRADLPPCRCGLPSHRGPGQSSSLLSSVRQQTKSDGLCEMTRTSWPAAADLPPSPARASVRQARAAWSRGTELTGGPGWEPRVHSSCVLTARDLRGPLVPAPQQQGGGRPKTCPWPPVGGLQGGGLVSGMYVWPIRELVLGRFLYGRILWPRQGGLFLSVASAPHPAMRSSLQMPAPPLGTGCCWVNPLRSLAAI